MMQSKRYVHRRFRNDRIIKWWILSKDSGGRADPKAVIYTNISGGQLPLQVDFDANGTYASKTPVTYEWNFGDGNTDTGVVVSHTYVTRGYFTVSLTVTDAEGTVSVAYVHILVGDASVVVDWGEVSYDTTNSATAAIYITNALVGVDYELTISGDSAPDIFISGNTPSADFVIPVDISLFSVGTITASVIGVVTGNPIEPATIATVTISEDIYERDPSGELMVDPSGNLVKRTIWRGFGQTILENGGFDSEDSWTVRDNWTIGGGVATADPQGVNSNIRQDVSYTIGKNYRAMFDMNVTAQGRVVVWIDGTAFVEDNPVTGRWLVDLEVSTASPSFSITVQGNFQGTIDNVVLMEEL